MQTNIVVPRLRINRPLIPFPLTPHAWYFMTLFPLQVRKMGDRILAQIIPILREGMASPAATTRQVRAGGQGARLAHAARGHAGGWRVVRWCMMGFQGPASLSSLSWLQRVPQAAAPLPSLSTSAASPSPAGRVQRAEGGDGERNAHAAGRPSGRPAAAHPGGGSRLSAFGLVGSGQGRRWRGSRRICLGPGPGGLDSAD